MPKISIEKSKCIGCGTCCSICPKFFEMGEDGHSHLKNSRFDAKNNKEELETEKPGCALEAERMCPAQCIHIKYRN